MKKIFISSILIVSAFFLNQCGSMGGILPQQKEGISQRHTIRPSDQANLYMFEVFDQVLAFTVPRGFVLYGVKDQFPERKDIGWFLEIRQEKPNQFIYLLSSNDSYKKPYLQRASLEWIFKMHSTNFMKSCVNDTFSYVRDIDAQKILDNFEYNTYVFACNSLVGGEMKNVEFLNVTIKGKRAYYTVAWSEHSPSTSMPLIDKQKWQNRLQQLLPIELLDSFPETHPGLSKKGE